MALLLDLPMQETSGTTLGDSSASNNDATLGVNINTLGALPAGPGGIYQTMIPLTAAANKSATLASSIDVVTSWTAQWWGTRTAGVGGKVYYHFSSGSYGIEWLANNNLLIATGLGPIEITPVGDTAALTHWAVTYNAVNGAFTLYKSGVSNASVAGSTGDDFSVDGFFVETYVGAVCGIRFYNELRTPTQILADVALGLDANLINKSGVSIGLGLGISL